jgi:hypothetical protein
MAKLNYWTPNQEQSPRLGDCARAIDCGKHGHGIYTWYVCRQCKRERWVARYILSTDPLCNECARHSKGKKETIYHEPDNITHKLGDQAKAIAVGKHGHGVYVWTACPKCGFTRWVEKYEPHHTNGYCQKCSNKYIKRGKRTNTREVYDGYQLARLEKTDPFYCMTRKDGYVMEHRLVVARAIGRPLLKTEVVHHKNGIRNDNRYPDNLELTPSLSAHSAITRQCMDCGLRKEIRLLHWQIKELREQLQIKLGLE